MRLVARYARGPFDEFVKFTHCATPPTKGHCQYESYVSNALREGVQRGERGVGVAVQWTEICVASASAEFNY